MQSFTSFKSNIVRLLLVCLLLVLISACGNDTPSQSGSSSTPGNQNETIPSGNAGVAFDVPGLLHIQSPDGISCTPESLTVSNQRIMPAALVLATQNLTYESAEIQKMATYVNAALNAAPSTVPLPSTLRFVPGAPPTDLSLWNAFGNVCNGRLQITNIGNSTIQLSHIEMEYMGASRPNTFSYRLMDICSLPITLPDQFSKCPPRRGGGGQGYAYQFQLGQGSTSTVIQGQLTNNGGETGVGPTLDPGQVAFVSLSFVSSGTPGNLVYTVRPKLTLDMVGEQRITELPRLDSTLAFADASQFSCYTLRGDTFELVGPGPHDSVWCV